MKKFLVLLLVSTGLAACSASVDGGSPVPSVTPKEKAQVAGPNLDGVWASSCLEDSFDRGSKKITMVIKDKSVHRTTEKFLDLNCTRAGEVIVQAGSFTFQKQYAKEIYEVEYRFDLGNGVTSITFENLRLADKILWIGEFYSGDGVEPLTPLARIGDVK